MEVSVLLAVYRLKLGRDCDRGYVTRQITRIRTESADKGPVFDANVAADRIAAAIPREVASSLSSRLSSSSFSSLSSRISDVEGSTLIGSTQRQ